MTTLFHHVSINLKAAVIPTYFEGHVLQEMGHSIVGISLKARSCVNPKANSGSGWARVLSGHTQAIVQDRDSCGWHIEECLLVVGSGSGGPPSHRLRLRSQDYFYWLGKWSVALTGGECELCE